MDFFRCPHCGREFPATYPTCRGGLPNPLAKVSAMNNFGAHRSACAKRVGKRAARKVGEEPR